MYSRYLEYSAPNNYNHASFFQYNYLLFSRNFITSHYKLWLENCSGINNKIDASSTDSCSHIEDFVFSYILFQDGLFSKTPIFSSNFFFPNFLTFFNNF